MLIYYILLLSSELKRKLKGVFFCHLGLDTGHNNLYINKAEVKWRFENIIYIFITLLLYHCTDVL